MVFMPSSLESAVRLSSRFMSERFQPDKAIDVIDEAGAARALLPPSRQKRSVTPRDIEQIVAEMAQIPSNKINTDDKVKLRRLEEELQAVIYGQDQAINKIAKAIKLARAGVRDPEKPIGSFLFTGPTGVGKTELSRQLAGIMGIFRFLKHGVALILAFVGVKMLLMDIAHIPVTYSLLIIVVILTSSILLSRLIKQPEPSKP